ncbi:DUF3536 domain-containing protein [Nitratidesulfovibrio sp. SRB-5]|uniref:DUF3536 domain-containing protein n=1 Tax=Nitratidesulfovibrio sp. SRB-5 TaxID=2872636 RepID=UPI001027BC41|nr:DUF3536 domain-containing protein [Nitratidesulfovibrio sp. SRB-5]MBZ2173546.1 DUF3536 domain-containing protein [Nitratidesulfovibrio sp. SRB-5]RXF78312.1 DUF3536 domain-containing protein [Desulfovibrio sp. DS-1]
MPRNLCIHGHFYQPPREDPWLDDILPEGSAAPATDWNTRILRESYAPLGWARRLDREGRIGDILNCYEWTSFNAGPTLLRWMDRHAPDTLRRMVEGDRTSAARWGHGNAMAQVYHHVIMPLATPLDREVETAWAVADFAARFGRAPEGMWLPEAAVDTPTLETLAAAGIAFTVLAPRQARAVAALDGIDQAHAAWQPVHEGSLDIGQPYRAELPSGRSIDIFFYNGPISRAVAFEQLLRDGEIFWRRLADAARALPVPPGEECGTDGAGGTNGANRNCLLAVCTDGETYGHHFTFGEMALAHVLAQGYAGRDGVALTNFAAFLHRNPPRMRVLLHEPSSWSCAHGVERWRSDCGCTDGGHPGWNQRWRGPLRQGLDALKQGLDAHFAAAGAGLFRNPKAALLAYGQVLARSGDASAREAFAAAHLAPGIAGRQADAAWKLLAMQEAGLASFASCAWFFDEISRIEPVNAMTCALRALDLCTATGGPDLLPRFAEHLAHAVSNKPEEGSGADILSRTVLPRRGTDASLVLQALWRLRAEHGLPEPGATATHAWPGAEVDVTLDALDALDAHDAHDAPEKSGGIGGIGPDSITGTAALRLPLETEGRAVRFTWQPPGPSTSARASRITVRPAAEPHAPETSLSVADLPLNARQALLLALLHGEERNQSPRRAALARQALALVDPWEEAQHDMPASHLWADMAPHLGLALVTEPPAASLSGDESGSDAAWRQGLELLRSLQPSPRQRHGLHQLIRDHLLELLAAPAPDWDGLCGAVQRTREVAPDFDWWAVQNLMWERLQTNGAAAGTQARNCAALLGFRV